MYTLRDYLYNVSVVGMWIIVFPILATTSIYGLRWEKIAAYKSEERAERKKYERVAPEAAVVMTSNLKINAKQSYVEYYMHSNILT